MDLIAKSPDADVRVFHLPDGDFEFAIGRGSGCDIQLADNGVSRHHAVLSCESGIYYIQDAGSRAGTFLEGVPVTEKAPLGVEMDVRIGRFTVVLSDTVDDDSSASALFPNEAAPPNAGESPMYRQAPARQDAAPPDGSPAHLQAPARQNAAPPSASGDADFMAEFRDAALMCDSETMALKRKLHLRILEKMNLSEDALDFTSDDTLLPRLEECLNQTLKEQRHELPSSIPYDVFRQALLDELVGYGPITPILRSPRVSEVMVNGPDCIFVESKGRLFESGVRFFDEKHLQQIIRRIVEPLGRHVDDASPMVDARLPDGSRVNAVIPPLALDGSSMTIRKFSEKKLTTDDLVGFGSMTKEMALFLEEAVKSRQNIIVSGGTGSGKTTLLNVLSQFIPRGERVVTVEDSAELKLSHRNIVRLEARPANIEGKGRISIRDLVINTLRMRPDRIIVGECRGAEALDMLQAMNTGHDGSLTTLHANTPRDALSRLENMVMMAGFELPSSAIREQICSAVNIIVQQTRLPDGSRKIVNITEVTGKEGDVITMQDIFVFTRTGFSPDGRVEGYHTATGNIPYFIEGLRESGNLSLDMGVFVPKT
ncbi:MAG: Flp pilus assembly complex ATPase component TadA [Kiritimatiellae bacterium]|nr:Flp pilus assembly complex ATPase component TadA [Kiritimatiellia bacterium]